MLRDQHDGLSVEGQIIGEGAMPRSLKDVQAGLRRRQAERFIRSQAIKEPLSLRSSSGRREDWWVLPRRFFKSAVARFEAWLEARNGNKRRS
jgi:hypothetical protein